MSRNASSLPLQKVEKGKIWTKDFALICLANFFIFLGFQMTLPTLPLFVEELGGNDQLIGLIVGIFTFSALIIRPFAGHALETKGRGFIYLVGLAIFVISVSSFSIAASIAFLLAMRMVQGVGWGMSTTASGTIAADLIPADRRGEGLGYFGLSGNLALAFGPSLGLILAEQLSFNLLFLICGGLGGLALLLSSQIKFKKAERTVVKPATVKWDIYEKAALKPSLLLFFITVTFGGIASFLPLYTTEKGIDGLHFYFLIYAVALLISRTYSGQLYDKKGHRAIFIPGTAMIFVAMLLIAWLPNMLVLLIAASFYGLGFGMIQPGLQAWAINSSPKNRRGMATATFFSSFDLGVGVGAMIFGQIGFWLNYQSIYIACSVSVLMSMIIYMIILKREGKQSV